MKQNTDPTQKNERRAEKKEQYMNSSLAWKDAHPGRVAWYRKKCKSYTSPATTLKNKKINDLLERFSAYKEERAMLTK